MFEMTYSMDVPMKKSFNSSQELTFSDEKEKGFDFKGEETRPCGRTTIRNH